MNPYQPRNNYKGPRRPEDPVKAGLVYNEQIRHNEVRVLDVNGDPVGVMPSWKALKLAKEQELDLVEITSMASPPVVRIVDLNKWIYTLKRAKKEQDKKARENVIILKEIQLRPVTDKHDLEVKINHAKEFLADDNKVKIVIKFKGRELSFSAKGFEMMNSFLIGVGECKVEKEPTMNGREIMAILAPLSKKSS